MTELLEDWAAGQGDGIEVLQVVGEPASNRMIELRDSLQRNRIPTGFYDVAAERGRHLLDAYGLVAPRLPVVIPHFNANSGPLEDPADVDIVEALGASQPLPADQIHDVAIVGAGPAGLAAAVYAASEGPAPW